MDFLIQPTASRFLASHSRRLCGPTLRCGVFSVTSSFKLPFEERNAKYFEHLKVAVDVVERACRLCVDVQKSLFSSDGRIVEKVDQTPVTVADFGVQALVSLELSQRFPSIPLVAEEDSTFVRENNLVDAVVQVVTDKSSITDKELNEDDILKAIDRGGKDAYSFGAEPATYWILDPIDGTGGFVRGENAVYVVGLALVVKGKIVLGVMGCPNWLVKHLNFGTDGLQDKNAVSTSGIIMISHLGCGTWITNMMIKQIGDVNVYSDWTRCVVDKCNQVKNAHVCIQDSQSWESLPLSTHFDATTQIWKVGERQILLMPICCGSLCKYLMVASGRASVYILGVKAANIVKAWDHAAGVICVREAHGKVTDWKGIPLDFGADEAERRAIFPSGGVLATNGRLHDRVLEFTCSS